MDPFLKVFFAIDKDGSEKITISELHDYVKQNNLDETMVSDWQRLFDAENTGYITLEKFCDTLGIAPNEVKQQRVNQNVQQKAPTDLPAGVTILSADVSETVRNEILQKMMELLNSNQSREEASKQMKSFLDAKYGLSWVVLLTEDSFWLQASHLPDSSCYCRIGDVSCLIWRTYKED